LFSEDLESFIKNKGKQNQVIKNLERMNDLDDLHHRTKIIEEVFAFLIIFQTLLGISSKGETKTQDESIFERLL
jgi:hypothetical protein